MLTFIQFAGCIKKPVTTPPVEVCNITHMKYSVSGLNTYYHDAVFTYNNFANPTSVIILPRASTGDPNITFLYDQYNRLTDGQ